MKNEQKELIEKLKPYLTHKSFCNVTSNWDEAIQAMGDTPEKFRDESWHLTYNEIHEKMNICNCGLEQLESLKGSDDVPSDITDEEIEAIKFIDENPDCDKYWLSNVINYLDSEGGATDNSCELANEWQKQFKIAIKVLLRKFTQPPVEEKKEKVPNIADDLSKNEKDSLVKKHIEMTAKYTLQLFMMLGLKSHIESMVVNDVTGEEYIFAFQTVDYFKQHFKREQSQPVSTDKSAEIFLKDYIGEVEIPFSEMVTVYYPAIIEAMEEYAIIYHKNKLERHPDIEETVKQHLNKWRYK
jgi:hypothetical protein